MYRKGVGIILLNHNGQVFVGKRIFDARHTLITNKSSQMQVSNLWQMQVSNLWQMQVSNLWQMQVSNLWQMQVSNLWQMPQGGVDDGESYEEALVREVEEEIGLTKNDFRILKKSDTLYKYDLPDEMRPKFWQGKFKGQEQAWFCCLLTSDEKQINISTSHPEFESWKWISPYSIPSVAVEFKLDMYKQLLHDFFPTMILSKGM